MEGEFYTRATAKLKKSSQFSFATNKSKKRDGSSVYSIDGNPEDYTQYPMGCLTTTQKLYLTTFIESFCKQKDIKLDNEVRSIHKVGLWKFPNSKITVSCTILQPNVTNTTIVMSGITMSQAKRYSKMYFSQDESQSPAIIGTVKWCQVLSRHAIPFMDKLIESKILLKQNASLNNIALSKTQPIFYVCKENSLYECRLTHASCQTMAEVSSGDSTSTPPATGAHNYTFRSNSLRGGEGTGPSITIHSTGIIQYQGRPEHIKVVVSSFRKCIDDAMLSNLSAKFI